jgi:hypothetical protein
LRKNIEEETALKYAGRAEKHAFLSEKSPLPNLLDKLRGQQTLQDSLRTSVERARKVLPWQLIQKMRWYVQKAIAIAGQAPLRSIDEQAIAT